MKNKKPKVLKVTNAKLDSYGLFHCPICKHYFFEKKDAKHCRDSCYGMILAYMDNNKLSYEDAKSLFLMELL